MSEATRAVYDRLSAPQALKYEDVDRRFDDRYHPSVLPPVRAIRLGGRSGLTLVNVARTGALFAGDVRMTPGATVTLRLVTQGSNVLMRCQIVRCEVAKLSKFGATYHTAVSFNEELRVIDEAVSRRMQPTSWQSILEVTGRDVDRTGFNVSGLLGN